MNDISLVKIPPIQGTSSIADLLDFRARSHGEKEALVFGDERITYNQLAARAKAIAHHLGALDIAPDDKVALYLPNSIDYIAGFFGTAGMGGIVVPVNPLLKPDEIAHVLQDSEAKAIVVHQDLLPQAITALEGNTKLRSILVASSTTGGDWSVNQPGVRAIELNRQRHPDNIAWPTAIWSEDQAAVIVYTSGTTGKPKGAVLTHRNLLSVFPARLDMFNINETDRCLGTLPLCHIYGMTLLMIGTVARAATLVVMTRFDAQAALDVIEKESITILPAVPAMYQMMLFQYAQNKRDVSSLRICFSGAAPLPAEAIKAIESTFGAPLIEGYALTETSCAATINPLHGTRKAGSVGPVVPGVTVDIFDDNGKKLPAGPDHVGEIGVSGPNVMLGYFKQPEATAEVLKNSYFFTGDLGYKDEDGYIFIVGRKKELIIRGGANVYPREVEEVIMRIPGVREVAVIGIPDDMMGERVKAIVATGNPEVTEAVVKEHCERFLANYKVPRLVEFVDQLPRNSTGKVLKRLLT